MAFTPRYCFIKKCAGFKGFGFTLHTKVQNEKVRGYINKIDAGSPAEQSGLLVGDRLLKVNGVIIEKDSHQQIIERIITSGDEVRLLVVDRETDDYYTGMGMAITALRAEDRQVDSEPNAPETQHCWFSHEAAPIIATTYSDVINETATTDVPKTNTVQQTVRPVSTKKIRHSSRHTQAPISNSISAATRQLLPSSSQYRTYGSNIGSRSSGYNLGTLPPTINDAAAWFACLCCFWPAGLVALVKNSEACDCAARGDMTGANIAAQSARRWTSISICVGVVIYVITVTTGVCIGLLKSLPAQNT